MLKHSLRIVLLALLAIAAASTEAAAQGAGLSQAVLALPSNVSGAQNAIDGRLYSSLIRALIADENGDGATNFSGFDRIDMTIAPRTGTRPGLSFNGTRPEFDRWVQDNADALLALLFPGDLAAGVLGRDPSQLYSQQLLLTTALGADRVRESARGGRSAAGGLFEVEWFDRDGSRDADSAWAVQGLYGINPHLSLQGRFAHQREDVTTTATSVAVDYHPFIEINRDVVWRVGGMARSGVLYSQSEAMNLGSLDFGGGGWVSGRKDFEHVRVGGAALFQGSTSWVPSAIVGEDFAFLADAINDRGMNWDLTYGVTVGVDTSARTAIIGKYLETHTVSSSVEREPLRHGLVGLSYAVSAFAAVDVGYKFSATSGLLAHSIFMQGNFGW